MMDVTFFVPDHLKKRAVNSLVHFLADRAEQLGSHEAARNIRRLSTDGDFLVAADNAFKAGVDRFVKEYRERDEDLVEAITEDALFWESPEIQKALVSLVSRPGARLTDEHDTVIRHFESVLQHRVNRKRVDDAVVFLLGAIAEELWSLPGASEIREIYALQMHRITADAAREQVALLQQQLTATTSLTQEIRKSFVLLTTAMEQKLLTTSAQDADLGKARLPLHNLPQPSYVRFIGRDAELEWLRKRLSPNDRAWQLAITGIGGVGKSALASAIAWEYIDRYASLDEADRFDAIVWVSAKEEVLTASGKEIANLPSDLLRTLEDVYRAISQTLEREDITRASPEDQPAFVDNALKRQRTLLIVDNLESIRDERIKPFLRNVPSPTKVIVTSRAWLDVADVLQLKGMAWEDTERLLIEETSYRHIELSHTQHRRLFDLTDGLPLPLKLAVARLASGQSFDSVDRWLGDSSGELPEYCVQGQAELIGQSTDKAMPVLLAVSLFDRVSGASKDSLAYIADASLFDCENAINELQRYYLIGKTKDDRYWVLPIVQRYAQKVYTHDVSTKILLARWVDWLCHVAADFGENFDNDWNNRQVMSKEYPNLLLGIRWCTEQSIWDKLIELCRGAWPFAYRTGLVSDFIEIAELLITAGRSIGDELAEGEGYLQLGRITKTIGNFDAAWNYLDKAVSYLSRQGATSDLLEALITQLQIHRDRKEFDLAREIAVRIQELSELDNTLDSQFKVAAQLAVLKFVEGQDNEALEWLAIAEEKAALMDVPYRTAAVRHIRGKNLAVRERFLEAEPYVVEAARLHSELGERVNLGTDKLLLAEIYLMTGRYPEAQQNAIDARDLFERVGLKRKVIQTESLLAEIRAAQCDLYSEALSD